jgi:hypothetical protein
MWLFHEHGYTRNPGRVLSKRCPSVCTLLSTLLVLLLLCLTACNRVVLDERFYDPRLPKWSVIDDPDTVQGPSVWRVEPDGWLHQRSNIWGRRGDFIGRWYGTYLVAGDASWSNYTMSLKARPDDNDGFGVVFRFTDPEHFYRLLFIQDGMNGGPITRLDKRNGADYTEIWSEKSGYRVGAEMVIEISADGDNIKATADGKPLVQFKDASYSRGKIGLFCFAQAGQAFNDVRVTLD